MRLHHAPRRRRQIGWKQANWCARASAAVERRLLRHRSAPRGSGSAARRSSPGSRRVRSGGRPGIAGSGVCGAASLSRGSAAQQRLGVGHARRLEQISRVGARLDDAAGIHHRDVVGAAGDDAEIVGDQDHRHAAAGAARAQQIEDLRLHGDVERRGRLVGDQQLGLAGRARWRSPRAAACRPRAVRDTAPAAAPARGCRPRPAVRRCACRRPAPSSSRLRLQRLDRSGVPMVSTGLSEVIGSWKTMPSDAAAQLAQTLADRRPRRSCPSNSTRPDSLAFLGSSCRIARDSMVLPEPDSPTMPSVRPAPTVEVDTAIDGAEIAARRRQSRPQRPRPTATRVPLTARPAADRSAPRSVSPTRLKAQHGQEHRRPPGGRRVCGAIVEALAALPDHAAPARFGGGTPRPRKDSDAFDDDGDGDAEQEEGEQRQAARSAAARAAGCAQLRGAERLRRDHEFAAGARLSVVARATRMKAGMPSTPRMQVRLKIDLAEIGGDGQRQDQRRKGQQHVHAADHQRLEPAAEIAGEHAERAADERAR